MQAMSAPAPASASAIARPSPVFAPVTAATDPTKLELFAHRKTFMGTQATSLYSWFSPPMAQMKL